MTYIVAVSFVIFTPPQDVATELESPFLGAQAVEDWVPSDDDEGGAPRSPVDMPSPTPSPPSPVVAEDVAEPVEVGEETAPTEQDETPGSVKEHLEVRGGGPLTPLIQHPAQRKSERILVV